MSSRGQTGNSHQAVGVTIAGLPISNVGNSTDESDAPLKPVESVARATHTPLGNLFLDATPCEPLPITMGTARLKSPRT